MRPPWRRSCATRIGPASSIDGDGPTSAASSILFWKDPLATRGPGAESRRVMRPIPISSRKAVGPADDVSSRLPLDPYPSGWYAVAFSREIAAGEVKRRQFVGREVVAFRTESGVAAVFEAHCPHLGAHFGHGGCVAGETLRCPMHHFHFATNGACTATGAGYGRPPAARAGALPVREQSGVLLAWHHPEGAAPTWEPPALAGAATSPPHQRHLVMHTHVQEIAENLFDIGHLAAVHGYEEPEMVARPAFEGPVIEVHNRMSRSAGFLGRVTRRIEVDLKIVLHGLGIYVIDTVAEPGGLATRTVFTTTPVAPGRLDFRISAWVTRDDATLAPMLRWMPRRLHDWLMGRLLMLAMMNDVRQDQQIFAYKRHLLRPGLADADAAVPLFRRWARQFYPAINDGPPSHVLRAADPGEP
jgi:nitrite reductase/ring-hydroxylating ferredoxin subunit